MTNEVRRWRHRIDIGDVIQSPRGEYVLWEDYERLRKLLDGRTFVTGSDEPSAPQYRKWPGEPPHCMSCDCGMTEEQKKTVPMDDYLRVHNELMELRYPGSTLPTVQATIPTPGPAVDWVECPKGHKFPSWGYCQQCYPNGEPMRGP